MIPQQMKLKYKLLDRKYMGKQQYKGLERMPTTRHYWSRNTGHVWHFTDNDLCPPGNRIYSKYNR